MVRKTVGLIVNPIAGMGGKVGLKGTDGPEILKKAIQLGAQAQAPERAITALKELLPLKDTLHLITCPGNMGEYEAQDLGFDPIILERTQREAKNDIFETTAADTENAARTMMEKGAELIMFAGGDGTARNIYNAVRDKQVVLGIPAGVKIHSPVFATNPQNAGRLAAQYLKEEIDIIRETEVMDVDEDAFRQNIIAPKLYGYLRVPYQEELIQNPKSGSVQREAADIDGIADRIIEEMESGVVYILGPGTTTRLIMDKLGLDYTLLGIDVVLDKKLVVKDASEKDLLKILHETEDEKEITKAQIIVTIIGGQGYIFGRGNQQISPEVIRMVGLKNIRIIASRRKLNELGKRPLLVDTNDPEINRMLTGYVKVLVSYYEEIVRRITGP